MVCTVCGREMMSSAQFCSGCGRATQAPVYAKRRLERSRINRTFAGVCGGFAEYFGWDVTVVRIVMVLLTVFGVGSPVVAYLIAWLVMPSAPLYAPTAYGASTASCDPQAAAPTAEPGAPAAQA